MNVHIYPILNNDIYDSAYSAITKGSDGNIYFSLCSHAPGANAGVFSLNPKTSAVEFLFDVSRAGEMDSSHGKVHTPMVESKNSELFFATHFAYPYGIPQDVSYEGGRLISYNLHTKKLDDFGIVVPSEGVIALALDKERLQAYMLTIPSGYLVRCDIATRTFHEIGRVPSKGSICRNMVIDENGDLYGSYEDNGVFIYHRDEERLEFMDRVLPMLDTAEWNSASRGGVNKLGRNLWRCSDYDRARKMIYGVLGADSSAFLFNLRERRAERLPSLVEHSGGENLSLIYPTLSLASGIDRIFYMPVNGCFDYCRSENIDGWSYLMSLDKSTNRVENLGIVDDGGRKVFGVAGATSGDEDELYFLGAVERNNGEGYSNFNIINQKPFHLAVIKINIGTNK